MSLFEVIIFIYESQGPVKLKYVLQTVKRALTRVQT